MVRGGNIGTKPVRLSFMYRPVLSFFICLSSFLLSQKAVHSAPPVAAHSKTIDAYVLKQDGKTVGPQLITISARGLRCQALRSKLILLCSAPDYQVVLYSPETKRCKTTSIKLYRGYLQKQMALFSGQTYFDKPVVLQQKQRYFDLPGSLFNAPPGYGQKMRIRYGQGQVTGGEPAHITYKVLNLPGIDSRLETVLERYYSVPEKGGLPLEYSWVAVSNQHRVFLATAKVEKQKVDESLFVRPPGLDEKKTAEEVYLDGRAEGSDDVFSMFGRR